MSRSAPPDRRRRSVGRRARAQAETRQKVLAAAKQLFSEKGYERTTVRDIAAAAGLSTGAIFVSFSNKADLFGQLVLIEGAAAYEDIENALRMRLKDPTAKIDDVLLAMLEIAYRGRPTDLRFILETMSVAWSSEMGAGLRDLLAQWPVTKLISLALEAAVDRGQISPKADIRVLRGILWDVALSMVPRAVFDAWPLERVTDHLRAANSAILAGWRAVRGLSPHHGPPWIATRALVRLESPRVQVGS